MAEAIVQREHLAAFGRRTPDQDLHLHVAFLKIECAQDAGDLAARERADPDVYAAAVSGTNAPDEAVIEWVDEPGLLGVAAPLGAVDDDGVRRDQGREPGPEVAVRHCAPEVGRRTS